MRGLQPLLGAFCDPISLELGYRGEDVEYEPTCRSCRIDAFREGLKAGTLGFYLVNDVQEVLQAPCEPVIFRTTTTSPSRISCIIRSSSGRDRVVTVIVSAKMRSALILVSASCSLSSF